MTRLNALLTLVAAVFCLWLAAAPAFQPPANRPASKQPKPKPPSVSVQISSEPAPIVLEAEAGTIVAPIQVYENPDASGGKYVMTPEPPNENLATGGQVEFKLNMAETAKYNLWLRVEFDDSCDNSLFAKVGDGAPIEVTNNTFKVWQWIKAGRIPFELKSGPVALIVGSRENGSRLDEMLLTQNLKYVPVGVETSH